MDEGFGGDLPQPTHPRLIALAAAGSKLRFGFASLAWSCPRYAISDGGLTAIGAIGAIDAIDAMGAMDAIDVIGAMGCYGWGGWGCPVGCFFCSRYGGGMSLPVGDFGGGVLKKISR